MARHTSTQLPAMKCTQRLDPSLLDELLVETRTIEELDLDGARVTPFLKIDVRSKPPPPPQPLRLDDLEPVDGAIVVRNWPSRAITAQPGGTVCHAARRWWIASNLIVFGALVWALIWKVL